jgi:hypothetical protein
LRDAVLFSCGANAAHGVPRTNEDKRRAVMKLLQDAEWSGWVDLEIARRAHVSNHFVRKLRDDIAPVTRNIPSEPRTFTTLTALGCGVASPADRELGRFPRQQSQSGSLPPAPVEVGRFHA